MNRGNAHETANRIFAMTLHQQMAQLTLNGTEDQTCDVHSNQQVQEAAVDESVSQQEIDQLSAEIQDIHTRAAKAYQQTIELKGAIRAAYGLSFDLEVWEQISIDEQMEFGKLESAVKFNDFFLEFLTPMIGSLPELLETGEQDTVEIKMSLIKDYLFKTEENIVMVVKKLEERALAKRVDEMKL